MTRTKLSLPNVALLLLGIVISLIDAFLSVMTAGFGADPIHDLKSFAMQVVILASLALLPSSLIVFLWSRIGVVVSWSIVGLCSLCVPLGGAWAGILFLILAFVQSIIATAVDARSNELPNSDVALG
jgi:hypothetical protein